MASQTPNASRRRTLAEGERLKYRAGILHWQIVLQKKEKQCSTRLHHTFNKWSRNKPLFPAGHRLSGMRVILSILFSHPGAMAPLLSRTTFSFLNNNSFWRLPPDDFLPNVTRLVWSQH